MSLGRPHWLFPRGEYAVMWMFCSLQYATRSSCGNKGCASTWLTAGTTPVFLMMFFNASTPKFETPIALTYVKEASSVNCMSL